MSILIKGMEMPKDEEMLCINIYPDGKVCINLDLECTQIATAVSVPPHGRLIDADVLMKEMNKQENAMFEHGREFTFSFKSGGDVCTAWYNVEMMVEDAPTIIPAEEGE